VAVEAQRGDEAPFGVVRLEHLDVRSEVDAFRGQGGDVVSGDGVTGGRCGLVDAAQRRPADARDGLVVRLPLARPCNTSSGA
jgi:hypothetical protein